MCRKKENGFWIKPQPLPPRVQQVVDAAGPSPADPEGSWTGIPWCGEEPQQDADDL